MGAGKLLLKKAVKIATPKKVPNAAKRIEKAKAIREALAKPSVKTKVKQTAVPKTTSTTGAAKPTNTKAARAEADAVAIKDKKQIPIADVQKFIGKHGRAAADTHLGQRRVSKALTDFKKAQEAKPAKEVTPATNKSKRTIATPYGKITTPKATKAERTKLPKTKAQLSKEALKGRGSRPEGKDFVNEFPAGTKGAATLKPKKERKAIRAALQRKYQLEGKPNIGGSRSTRGINEYNDPLHEYDSTQASKMLRGKSKREKDILDEYAAEVKDIKRKYGVDGYKPVRKKVGGKVRGVGKATRGFGKAMSKGK